MGAELFCWWVASEIWEHYEIFELGPVSFAHRDGAQAEAIASRILPGYTFPDI